MSAGGVSNALDNKVRARYRITRYSVLWILAALLLIPYEIVMVVKGHDGGPLTHVVKWCYGEPRSLRWWMLGFTNTGFLAWLLPHFLFEGFGLKALITFTLAGLLVGATGYLLTR